MFTLLQQNTIQFNNTIYLVNSLNRGTVGAYSVMSYFEAAVNETHHVLIYFTYYA